MKSVLNIIDKYIGNKGMKTEKTGKYFIAPIFIALAIVSAVFAGTQHIEYGYVQNASDGTSSANSDVRIYHTSHPNDIVTSQTDSSNPSLWYKNVGEDMNVQWLVGDDHVVTVDKEINSGSANHAGYYAVTNMDITAGNDQYNDILRPIPVPVGTPGNNQASLNWAVATEDAGSPARTNVTGYRILRSTSQTGPFTFLTTVEGSTSYTDTTAVNGTTYYYVIQLVYRVASGTALTSVYYSANSNAVTPTAGGTAPTVTGVTPNTGVNTSTTNVVISGTGFTGVTAVRIGTWPVTSYTVVGTTSITAVIPSGLPVATYHVTVTNGFGTSATSSADQFTVTSPALGVIIIDDYEDPNPRVYYNAGTSIPTYSVTTADKHEGSKGIQIGYSYTTGWGGLVGGILPNSLDISSATGISFWVKGDGSSNTIRIDLKEATNEAPANGEVYSSTDISLTNTSWHKIELPYSAFVRNPYDGVTGGNNTFDKKIFHYQLMYTGTNASAANHFVDYIIAETVTVSGTPTVTSVIPNTGTNDATTNVAITGTNFGGVTAVKIGTWPVSSFTVTSALTMTAVIPAGLPVNTYHITVTNGYGTSATSAADQFTVTAPVSAVPTVTGVVPNTGVNTSTTPVTISGTNFTGITAVNIGTWPVTSYTVVGTTSITAVIPSGLPVGTYHVTVTNGFGTSATSSADQFTVTSPALGVIIIDDYEDPNPRIYYNAGDVPPTYSVTTADKHEGSKGIQIGYSYTSGWGGLVGGILPNSLDISSATGISFWVKGDGSSNTIRIDLKEATNEAPANGEVYSSTDISLSNTGWQKIELPYSAFVRNPYDGVTGGNNTFDKKIFHYQLMYTGTNASAANHFVDYIIAETVSVSGLPTVTSVIPNSGPNSTTTEVAITGTNFGGVTAVRIGTWPVNSFVVNSALSITAVIPEGLPVNTYHVTVTNGYGTSATSPADQFTVTDGSIPGSAPTVTGVIPNTGVNTTTTPVTISGTGFTGVTAVRIGTWPVTSYTVVDPTTITAVIPSGLPAGPYHVTVTNPHL